MLIGAPEVVVSLKFLLVVADTVSVDRVGVEDRRPLVAEELHLNVPLDIRRQASPLSAHRRQIPLAELLPDDFVAAKTWKKSTNNLNRVKRFRANFAA